MATVTEPILTDATGQDIVDKLDELVGAVRPTASDIPLTPPSGMTATNVQDGFSEIKQSLSLQKIAENIALGTTIDTKTITSINGAFEVWLLGKVNSTFRGSLAIPYSVFKSGYSCYIPCIGGNAAATIYVEYVSDTQIKCSTNNATFNYLDIYVKKQ